MEETNTETETADKEQGLNDFGDWMSPMLVKELRQGFRAHAFSIGFVVLQAILALNLFVTIPTASALGGVTRPHFLFFMISAALLLFQPVRGLSALSGEIKNDTLDTILLTSLSSWRITLGKWTSLVSQSLLIVVSVVPYLFMRYMLGGADLFMELLMVCYMFLFGAFLCALGVGLSIIPNFIVRSAAGFFALWGVLSVYVLGFWDPFFEDQLIWHSINPWLFHLILLISLSYLTFACLQYGAASIAARAENHATRLRIVSFLAILAALLTGLFLKMPEVGLVLSAFILGAVALLGFLEEPNEVPSVYRAFARRGIPGHLAAPVLMPGWHTMVLYSLHCVLFIYAFTFFFERAGFYGFRLDGINLTNLKPDERLLLTFIPGTAYVLVALAALFQRRSQPFWKVLAIITVSCGLLTALLGFLIDELRAPHEIILILFFLPSSYFIFSVNGPHTSDGSEFTNAAWISLALTVAALAYLLIKTMLMQRRIAGDAKRFDRQIRSSGQQEPPGKEDQSPSSST